ncbi:hypothetical protein BCEP4_310006 [Burkholderia cepacia]|nr:hypothetical protein BCEP4_310006 [Burkholderia cepacia]
MMSTGDRTKHARLAEAGRNGAGKGCRVWVERVMIPYNFTVFESKRAVFLPLRPRFLRVGSHPPTPRRSAAFDALRSLVFPVIAWP